MIEYGHVIKGCRVSRRVEGVRERKVECKADGARMEVELSVREEVCEGK